MMHCDIMPTICEDSHLQDDRNSPNSAEGANVEDMLLSMLEERDRLMDALKFAQEQLEETKNQLAESQKEKNNLQKHIETSISEDILSCSQQISSLKEQLEEKTEEVSDLISERNNTRLLLEHLECLVARHERSLRMTVVKRQNSSIGSNDGMGMDSADTCGISSEVEVLKALKSLFDHHKALDDKLRNRLKATQERADKLQDQLSKTEKLLTEERNNKYQPNETRSYLKETKSTPIVERRDKSINTDCDSHSWTNYLENKIKSHNDLSERLDQKEKELLSIRTKNDQFSDKISKMNLEMEKYNLSNERNCEEIKRLQNELKRRENQIENQNQRIKSLEQKNMKSEQNINLNSEILHKLRTEVMSKSNQINQLEEKNSSLQNRLLKVCRNSFSSENLHQVVKDVSQTTNNQNSRSLTNLNHPEEVKQNVEEEEEEGTKENLHLAFEATMQKEYMRLSETNMSQAINSIKTQFQQQISLLQEEIIELQEQLKHSQEDLNRCLEREILNENHNRNLVESVDRLLNESNERLQKHLEERMLSLSQKKELDLELDRVKKVLEEMNNERDLLKNQNVNLKRQYNNMLSFLKKNPYHWSQLKIAVENPGVMATSSANGAISLEETSIKNSPRSNENLSSVVFSSMSAIPRTHLQTHGQRDIFDRFSTTFSDNKHSNPFGREKRNISISDNRNEFKSPNLSGALFSENFTVNDELPFDTSGLTSIIQNRLNVINKEIKMIEEEREDTEIRAEKLESKVAVDSDYQDYINDSDTCGRLRSNTNKTNPCYTLDRNFPANRGNAFSPRPASQNTKSMNMGYQSWNPRKMNMFYDDMDGQPTQQPYSFSTATEIIDSNDPKDAIEKALHSSDMVSAKMRDIDNNTEDCFNPIKTRDNIQSLNRNFRMGLQYDEMGFESLPKQDNGKKFSNQIVDEDLEMPNLPRPMNSSNQSDINRIRFLGQIIKLGIPFNSWNTNLIVKWLEVYVNMPAWYVAAAGSAVRSGTNLLAYNDHDLQRQLGISNPLHRLKLRLAIQEMMTITNNHNNPSQMSPQDYQQFIETTKLQCQLSHEYIGNEWLPSLGLPQYRSEFMECLVDGRMLTSLTKRDLRSTLRMLDPFHRRSLVYGISFLKQFNFDKEQIEERRMECMNEDSDLVVWSNERFHTWLVSLNVKSKVLVPINHSGIHGALLAMDSQFDSNVLCNSLGIPKLETDTRSVIYESFSQLIEPYRLLQQNRNQNFNINMQSASEDSN